MVSPRYAATMASTPDESKVEGIVAALALVPEYMDRNTSPENVGPAEDDALETGLTMIPMRVIFLPL